MVAVSVGWIPSHSKESPNNSNISSGSVFNDSTVVNIKLEPKETKIAETVAVVFQTQSTESASSFVTTEPSSPPEKSNSVEVPTMALSKAFAEQFEKMDMDIVTLPSLCIHPENSPYVHKVGMPPRQKFFEEFTGMVKEIFFPNGPLRDFKGQPPSKKDHPRPTICFPNLIMGE
ncbi:hypothetical protein NE237_030232 [Protea cynaroides]|uniref:Uncharacterized protein n=1 Tax=Protea cynaroides TaxID=273540 RepID=A0A9Q0GTT9_9MAGN|nr:hypothetical protein NE237_030232 [Protea cynaroides]